MWVKILKQCLGQAYSMCNFGLNFILPQPLTFITHFDSIRICLNSPGYIWGQHLSSLLWSVVTLKVILEGNGTTSNSKIKLPNTSQWQSVVENTLIWIKHLALHKMKYCLIPRAFHKQVETNVIMIGREKNQSFDLKISLFWIVYPGWDNLTAFYEIFWSAWNYLFLSFFFFLFNQKVVFLAEIFYCIQKGKLFCQGYCKRPCVSLPFNGTLIEVGSVDDEAGRLQWNLNNQKLFWGSWPWESPRSP